MVTLESGTEYVYATERNSNSGTKENKESTEKYNNEISDKTEETYIIIKTDNGEQPLLLSALAPSVRGVAIVCDSAANGVVADNIKQAVCTLLDISEKAGKRYRLLSFKVCKVLIFNSSKTTKTYAERFVLKMKKKRLLQKNRFLLSQWCWRSVPQCGLTSNLQQTAAIQKAPAAFRTRSSAVQKYVANTGVAEKQ